MRALFLLAYVGLLAAGFYLGSPSGMLISAGVCITLIAGLFVFSTAHTEACEPSEMQRAMGRSTAFLASLSDPKR